MRFGAAVEVEGLVLKRDVYYTLEPAECDYLNFDGAAQIDSNRVLRPTIRPVTILGARAPPRADYVLGPGRTLCWATTVPGAVTRRAWGQSTGSIPSTPDWDGILPGDRAGKSPNRF